MEIKIWIDVWPYVKEVYPTTYPIMPKPDGCRRYMITCEIPDFDGDADHLVTGEVKAE